MNCSSYLGVSPSSFFIGHELESNSAFCRSRWDIVDQDGTLFCFYLQDKEEEREEGLGKGGGGEHVGDVGTLRGVQLCLLSPLLPIHSGAGSANQFNAKEKEIKQKHILKADISLHTYCKGALIPHIWVVKSSQRCIHWRQNRPKWTKSANILHSLC